MGRATIGVVEEEWFDRQESGVCEEGEDDRRREREAIYRGGGGGDEGSIDEESGGCGFDGPGWAASLVCDVSGCWWEYLGLIYPCSRI
ncbi:unnamed protein product [Linum tenue]|uniref:Uncharacterized protein n=1 Tax=Linum tenue TaxID=586396 RepID=A0AAV0LBZ1_9ROSI|nr:unnamed protein product [Linum tenue]